jgi:hypothetical protein
MVRVTEKALHSSVEKMLELKRTKLECGGITNSKRELAPKIDHQD